MWAVAGATRRQYSEAGGSVGLPLLLCCWERATGQLLVARYDTTTWYLILPIWRAEGGSLLITNVLGVTSRCQRPVKGLGATDTAVDRCVLSMLYVYWRYCWLLMLLQLLLLLRFKTNVHCCRGGLKAYESGEIITYEKRWTKQNMNFGFSMFPTRLGGPLLNRASSATVNASTTATKLGRDPGMRGNVPTAPLLAPHPRVQERTLGRRSAGSQKNKVHILPMHTRFPFGMRVTWNPGRVARRKGSHT